jgi:hypothetical protein
MITECWTAEERAQILRELVHAKEQGRLAADREDSDSEDAWDTKYYQLKAAYFEGLPRLVMSCCPFDGKPLVRTFDPIGFDGLWWEPDVSPEELPTCPHFCVLGGAVNYQGLPPRAGNVEIIPGPEIPFVYPRLLALPTVVAVISSLPMENGYLAYPPHTDDLFPHGLQRPIRLTGATDRCRFSTDDWGLACTHRLTES